MLFSLKNTKLALWHMFAVLLLILCSTVYLPSYCNNCCTCSCKLHIKTNVWFSGFLFHQWIRWLAKKITQPFGLLFACDAFGYCELICCTVIPMPQ
jgi:hypothetical protein